MIIRVSTGPYSWYYAWFEAIIDQDTIRVRCVSGEHTHDVRKERVHD
jgi:hypothetical protein